MEQYYDIISLIAVTFGVGWASGINLYATILTLGLMNNGGYIVLPEQLDIISDPIILIAAAIMYFIEFFADKIPGLDTAWDSIHSFIRIPMGAALAYGATGDQQTAIEVAALILGGGTAAVSHTAKSGTRVLVNTSPEPFSNWFLSITEDIAVILGLWAALKNPILFLVLFILFIILMIWLLPKVFRGIKNIFKALAGIFYKKENKSNQSALEKEVDNPEISHNKEN